MTSREFCLELVEMIEKGKIKSKRELNRWKQRLAKKHSLNELPTNPDILKCARRKSPALVKILGKKPVKTLSGIAVIAIMTSPHSCPGECVYCPSSMVEEETPKSYTGREPAAMRALRYRFDPALQVESRLEQLEQTAHSTEKVELIVMGGTFLSQGKEFRDDFMRRAINAVSGAKARTLAGAKKKAESSKKRITGITFETRPDYCSEEQVKEMLLLGGTRCELGVQVLSDAVYKKIKRNHSVKDVASATRSLKDAGFKVAYHIMPGLPGSSPGTDLDSFKEMFFNADFKPDMLKLYPCLVIKGTPLYKKFKRGAFSPLSTEQAIELISSMKRIVPPWVRIMRVQRDIPAQLIEGGVKKSNLRQLVLKRLEERKEKCNCIRCREAGLLERKGIHAPQKKARLFLDEYSASNGTELFISLENRNRNALFGFCRFRVPESSYIKEIGRANAVVRELRVFGKALPLHEREHSALQHKGIGQRLMLEAERLSREFGKRGVIVISGLGVKEYYRNIGYRSRGEYLYKKL